MLGIDSREVIILRVYAKISPQKFGTLNPVDTCILAYINESARHTQVYLQDSDVRFCTPTSVIYAAPAASAQQLVLNS